MEIFRTIDNPETRDHQFFSKDNMTLYTAKEIRQQFWDKAMSILENEWRVRVEVNAKPLSDKFNQNGKSKWNKRR